MYWYDIVFVLVFGYGMVLDDGFVCWLVIELVWFDCYWCFFFVLNVFVGIMF